LRVFLFLLLFSFTLSAQQIARLRFDDDFSVLISDSLKKEKTDYLKEIPFVGHSRISFGGEWREQYQSYTHFNFGEVPADFVTKSPYQLMHRVMLHANVELPHRIRVFAQLNNTARFWNPNPLTGQLDQDLLSLHQFLVDIPLSNSLKLRVGKQEYSFGLERFIATREGPNTRTPYYGVNLKYQRKNLQWDAFVSHPIKIKPGVFDDGPTDEILGGFYGNYRFQKRHFLEPYYLYFESDLREYLFKKGLEKRHTLGFRAFSGIGPVNYDIEIAHQSGEFRDLAIDAFMGVWDFNVALKKAFYVGFSGNYVPGDKSNKDGQLNTFNTLFARPPFGQTVALNITNTWNFSPYIRYQDLKHWLVTGRASFVSRQSTEDGIFTPNMTPARPILGKNQSSVAQPICNIYALDAQYFPTKHFSFQLELGYCAAGSYLQESGSGQNVHYYALRNVYRF
jgi:hypothetical protein